MARGVDGESGNVLILCQEDNNTEPCAAAHQGSRGWDQTARLGGRSFSLLHSSWTGLSPQSCWTTAESLGHRIYSALEFNTHGFCRKERQVMESVLGKSVYLQKPLTEP